MHIERLIHNMRKRGIPKQYVKWMTRCLKDCTTTLTFDGYHTKEFWVTNSLAQGDPFSVICYILYNADILSIANSKTEIGLLFIDDTAIITTGKNFKDTHNALRNIMTQKDGILEWASTHNCEFGIENFQLLDFSRHKTPNPIAKKQNSRHPTSRLTF